METRDVHLPESVSLADYAALRDAPARWLPAVAELAGALGLGALELRPVSAGSNLIASLGGELVIKLFPPILRHQHRSERLGLEALRGRLRVPTPEIAFKGEIGGWPYLVLTRLPGETLGSVWATTSEPERRALLRNIGELMAEVQALDLGPSAALEPEWGGFIALQAARARLQQARTGLPSHLLEDLDRYLAKTADAFPSRFRPVLLTGEYTPENLLVERRPGAYRLSGLLDFGDAMVGFGEYDLVGPGTFLVSGDPGRLRALLGGFGAVPTPDLPARLTRLLLLHRYSDLGAQIAIDGWADRVRDLDELEALLWPLA